MKEITADLLMEKYNEWFNKLSKIHNKYHCSNHFMVGHSRTERSGIIEMTQFFSWWLADHKITTIDIKIKHELTEENYHKLVEILRLLNCWE